MDPPREPPKEFARAPKVAPVERELSSPDRVRGFCLGDRSSPMGSHTSCCSVAFHCSTESSLRCHHAARQYRQGATADLFPSSSSSTSDVTVCDVRCQVLHVHESPLPAVLPQTSIIGYCKLTDLVLGQACIICCMHAPGSGIAGAISRPCIACRTSPIAQVLASGLADPAPTSRMQSAWEMQILDQGVGVGSASIRMNLHVCSSGKANSQPSALA